MSPIEYDPKAHARRARRKFLDDARTRVIAHPPFHRVVRMTIALVILATVVGAASGYFFL